MRGYEAHTAPLADKTAFAHRLLCGLLQRHDPSRIAVAWTGGKDSTVVLHLWKTCLETRKLGPLRAISIDTGLKFPEVTAFRDKLALDWNVELHLALPEVDLDSYPVGRDKLECCKDLKITPLKKTLERTNTTLLITGVRRFEHTTRADRPMLEERQDPPHTLVNPILDWTEMDIWAYTMENAFPYCSLYDQGYRSLGCKPCTEPACANGSERSGRDHDKEDQLGALHDLGYF